MRKLVLYLVLTTVFILFGTVAFAQQNSWVDLPTGVDANGKVTTTSVFGRYSDLEGVGEVFIECDPETGEELGAYIPGVKIGDQKTYAKGESVKKEVIDWDHPKEVLPIQVTIFAPNIPTDAEIDSDYYHQHQEVRRKTVNQFKWPMSTGFNRLIPGSDPDYWLFVAVATNPNPFPVSINLDAFVYQDIAGSLSRVGKSYQDLVMRSNETKYILFNRGLPNGYEYLAREWPQWDGGWRSGYSEGYYATYINDITNSSYPEILRTDGEPGYFTPYVRWDNTNPTVKPLIPMRLAYNFSISYVYDKYGSCYYGNYRGREWPPGYGCAEYDPVQDEWSIGVSFENFEKPINMTDEEWRVVVDKATSNAKTTLERLFRTWYPKTPFWCAWWRNAAYANGETGEWYGDKFIYLSPQPNFFVAFGDLEPVPPSDAPLPEGGNVRWGGWRYATARPGSTGYNLTAPVLVNYRASGLELNWTRVEDIQVPQGISIVRRTDPRYYDTDWMDLMPVLKAEPMFIEKYAFHATDGDFGYMTKETVPGYSLWVSTQERPVINNYTRPVRVYAKASNFIDYKGDGYYKLIREWEWTPETGWQMTSETKESDQQYWPVDGKADWYVEIKANHTFSGGNTSDVPITWSLPNGNLCWGNAEKMKSGLTELADYITDEDGNKQYRVDDISVDPVVSSPENPIALNPKESRTLFSADKTYAINFKRGKRNFCGWGDAQSQALDEISANIIPLINNVSDEAAFGDRTVATIGKTFVDGQGGVICGAQKYLIHPRFVCDNEWGMWRWSTDYGCDAIGFSPSGSMPLVPFVPGSTLYSYFNNGDYESVVVKGSDEVLGAALAAGDEARRINICNSGKWNGGRVQTPFWKVYSDGKIYPPEYPQD